MTQQLYRAFDCQEAKHKIIELGDIKASTHSIARSKAAQKWPEVPEHRLAVVSLFDLNARL